MDEHRNQKQARFVEGLRDDQIEALFLATSSMIGEIVHDIDVKDGKFERTEAPGSQRSSL